MINSKRIKIGEHYVYSSSAPGLKMKNVSKKYFSVEHLLTSYLREVKSRNIKLIVVLIPDMDAYFIYGQDLVKFYNEHGVKAIKYPIEDMDVPKSIRSFANLEEYLERKIDHDNILIHCAGGTGRTGMVIAGLLMKLGKSLDQAVSLVRQMKFGSIETDEQEKFLEDYQDYLMTNEAIMDMI